MTEATIHHVRVTYDDSDPRVRDFVAYLKDEKRDAEMRGYYGSAREIFPGEKYIMAAGNEFSFSCNERHICTLKLRGA
ncbi:MAG: hypothetical protein WDN09_01450 [bacterium]